MTPGVYSTVTALNARWAQQERIAENISGANAVGHKRQVSSFGAFQQAMQAASKPGVPGLSTLQNLPENQMLTGQTGVGSLTYAMPASTDWSAGSFKKTDGPLDAAISGNGFFSVQTPAGVRLTRNGHFSIDKDNRLVNDAGFAVLGDTGPITLPEGSAAIQADGSILVDGKRAAKLDVVEVPANELIFEGGSMFSTNVKPEAVKDLLLAPGALESSNVELPKEMVGMIQNQRMYDLLTRAFQTQDEGMSKAIQDLSGS